ncbi:MAG: DinB family protein [Nocardioidaceae bacterium]
MTQQETRLGVEAQVLLAQLDRLRSVVLAKVAGLDDDHLKRRLAPSTMSLGGLLSHLANVEDWWINQVIAQGPPRRPWHDAPWHEDRDWDWHRADGLTAEQLVAEFEDAVAKSRQILGNEPLLDAAVALRHRGQTEMVSVRWVVVHLLTEYARHCGHADLIREAIDGATGDYS